MEQASWRSGMLKIHLIMSLDLQLFGALDPR
jgi:hypothetical protein